MSRDLQELIADLEVSIVDAVDRLNQAEMDLLYVGVLDLEQRIDALHDAFALVAESITVDQQGARARTPESQGRAMQSSSEIYIR